MTVPGINPFYDLPPWSEVASYYNCGPAFDLFNGSYPRYVQATQNQTSLDPYSQIFTIVVTGNNASITFPVNTYITITGVPASVDLWVFQYQ